MSCSYSGNSTPSQSRPSVPIRHLIKMDAVHTVRMSSKGLFVVLEGIDGTGKTTLAANLAQRLAAEGNDVRLTAEPTDGRIGSLLREGVTDDPRAEALLFAADRACHTAEISKLVSSGVTVICDRYYASTLAYQAAAGAADMKWLRAMNDAVISRPDVTILLDADPELCSGRIDSRGERSRFEKLEYQKRVRENYLTIAAEDGFSVIDAGRGPDEVLEDAWRIIIGLRDSNASV